MDTINPETVIVKDSRFGKGIFTTLPVSKNSVIFKITGSPLTFKQTLQLGNDECYTLQIGINKYIVPNPPFHLSNHSCRPNCGINRQLQFIALQNIAPGEELVWDYSTSMLERHWTMKCDCEQDNCRHLIRDFDTLPIHFQEKYLHLGIVLPFIVEELYGLPSIKRVNRAGLVASK